MATSEGGGLHILICDRAKHSTAIDSNSDYTSNIRFTAHLVHKKPHLIKRTPVTSIIFSLILILMMIIARNSRAHKGKKERGEVKGKYGGACAAVVGVRRHRSLGDRLVLLNPDSSKSYQILLIEDFRR